MARRLTQTYQRKLRLLADLGRNGNHPMREDWQPLLSADSEIAEMVLILGSAFGWRDVVDACLQQTLDINATVSSDALKPLRLGSDSFERLDLGLNPLGAAVFFHRFEMGQYLLEKGANPNALLDDEAEWRVGDALAVTDFQGYEAQMEAFCVALEQAGWETGYVDSRSNTYASMAAKWKNPILLNFLLARHSDTCWTSSEQRKEAFSQLQQHWSMVQEDLQWGPLEFQEKREFYRSTAIRLFEIWLRFYPEDEAKLSKQNGLFEDLLVELNQQKLQTTLPHALSQSVPTRL